MFSETLCYVLLLLSIIYFSCISAVKAKNVVTLSVNKIFAQPGIGKVFVFIIFYKYPLKTG